VDLYPLINILAHTPGPVALGIGLLAIAWLIGLFIVMWRTDPKDRAAILDAYGRSFPWQLRRIPLPDSSLPGPLSGDKDKPNEEQGTAIASNGNTTSSQQPER
jgi:hypothetical protein